MSSKLSNICCTANKSAAAEEALAAALVAEVEALPACVVAIPA
jgi:hypothetical protein